MFFWSSIARKNIRMFASSHRSKLMFANALFLVCVFTPATSGGDRSWGYTIGQARTSQQANFCLEKKNVYDLAHVFETRGTRAGYVALSEIATCSTKVASFTPQKILRKITIETGASDSYTVTFLKVVMWDGSVEYLVTTREVRGAK